MVDVLLPIRPALAPVRRDLWIPSVAGFGVRVPAAPRVLNPERREAGKRSNEAFKRLYFPPWVLDAMKVDRWTDDPNGKFHRRFLGELDEAVNAIAVLYAAWAVSRGLGKTTDAEVVCVRAVCYQIRKLQLWISLNRDESEKRVGAIKKVFETNPLLLEDFPELCQPIYNFGGDPRSAHSEGMEWTDADLLFTNGMRVSGRGIDGQIRGFNIDMQRPDMVWIDDIENEFTVRSEAETKMRLARMENEVSALHGQGMNVRCSYVFLSTIPARGCIADRYTDQNVRPDWGGRRMGAMLKPPVAAAQPHWEKFCELARSKKDDESDADREHFAAAGPAIAEAVGIDALTFASQAFGMRKALEFFAFGGEMQAGSPHHKEKMLEGVEMLEPLQLPVWKWYWNLANKGESFVASELQCAPLAPEGIEEKQLDRNFLIKKRTLTPAFIVPRWAKHVFVAVDVQMHCLWVELIASSEDLDTDQLMEFGRTDTGMNRDGAFTAMPNIELKRRRVDQVIFDTLMKVHRRVSKGFKQEGTGRLIVPSMCAVDCGGTTPLAKAVSHAWFKAVIDFAKSAETGGLWVPLKGEKWTKGAADDALEQGASNWIRREDGEGRIDCNTDFWKTQHYNALLKGSGEWTSGEMPPLGSKYIHADEGFRLDDDGKTQIYSDPVTYARHCSAEKYVVELKTGVNVENSEKIGWQPVTVSGGVTSHARDNHGWDTGWMGQAVKAIWKHRMETRRPPRMKLRPVSMESADSAQW